MSTKPKILIAETGDFNPEVIDLLKEAGEVKIESLKKEDIGNAFRNYDIVWFRLGFTIDENVLDDETKCKIIVTPVTGLDHIDEELCKERGIEVISLRGETDFLKDVRATAELTIGITITLLRNLIPAYNSVLQGEWDRDLYRGNEIFGKTVGIIGMGRLGNIVAEYFYSLGATVCGYDIRKDFPENIKRTETIEELIQNSDIVSCHLSYTKETENMIGEWEFSRFKKEAIFINTSRGGIVDEIALINALKSGTIAGAALDVIKDEGGVNPGNPLIDYANKNSNLLIFPHLGGNTYESFEKTEKFLAEKLIQKIKLLYH